MTSSGGYKSTGISSAAALTMKKANCPKGAKEKKVWVARVKKKQFVAVPVSR
jgi:hypothetical protein